MDFNMHDGYLQVETADSGEVIFLQDKLFSWPGWKGETMKLAKLYKDAGYPELSQRAAVCSTWLQYDVNADGTKQLSAANFCHLRLCPLCIARRARKAAYKLSQVLDVVQGEHGAMYLFITLTIRNVPGNELKNSLVQLTAGWDRLMRHRHVQRAIKGWFRAIEITRKNKGYHPHIHAIFAVNPEYFKRKSELYITHAEWVERWKKALRIDYEPWVHIQVAKAKGEYSGGRAAAVEAAKYAVKSKDYIDSRLPKHRAVEIVRDYTEALFKRRLTAYGGWLKEAAKKLDADNLDAGDLVHIDQTTIREDVAELIEIYNWHFGAGDYVLTSRQINPLRLCAQEGVK